MSGVPPVRAGKGRQGVSEVIEPGCRRRGVGSGGLRGGGRGIVGFHGRWWELVERREGRGIDLHRRARRAFVLGLIQTQSVGSAFIAFFTNMPFVFTCGDICTSNILC